MGYSGIVWKLGLVPMSIANGLTGIIILFFLLTNLHGTLIDVGLVTGVGALALIPSQILWGKMIDSVGKCKPFLVLGFIGMGAATAAIPWATSVTALLVIASLKSMSLAATLPARQLLTVESETKDGWQKGLANMQFLTSMGETAGMGLGAGIVASVSFGDLFLLCGALCAVSAGALGVLAKEPGLMIQRRLVTLERATDTIIAASKFAGYPRLSPPRLVGGRLPSVLRRSTKFLLAGVFCFSLAGSAFYSPLPAYFLQYYPSQEVLLVFFAGSLAGSLSYVVVGRFSRNAGRSLLLSSTTRMVVLPMLLLTAIGAGTGLAAGALVLAALEALWSLFDVSSMFAFLETAKMGRAGFYGALTGLGSAGGGFLGGLLSMEMGFAALFMMCSLLCGGAMVAFATQFRGGSRSA
jgi:MFS family permease